MFSAPETFDLPVIVFSHCLLCHRCNQFRNILALLLHRGSLLAVFIAAGILQWVDNKMTKDSVKAAFGCRDSGCLSFFDAFWFMIVTVSTQTLLLIYYSDSNLY